VTIRAVRLYLNYKDKAVARAMNRLHFGVTGWIDARIKCIREQLRGPEAKGVNIVNVCFFESVTACEHCDSWHMRSNAFEYQLVFDLKSLIDVDPVENIRRLLPIVSQVCALAPWPQVRAIGAVLGKPLSAVDAIALKKSLEKWSAHVDETASLRRRRSN
jgi:hypothetical protein